METVRTQAADTLLHRRLEYTFWAAAKGGGLGDQPALVMLGGRSLAKDLVTLRESQLKQKK